MKTLLLALLSLSVLPTCYAGSVTGSLQGPSGLPIRNGTMNFVLNQPGLMIGVGAVVPTTASCYTDGTGNVVGLPNMIVAPTAAANYGSGTLPGGIYFIVTTWINNAGGESAPSPELRIQLTATGSLQIALPTSIPAAATGIRVYAATTSGAETLQGTQGLTGVFNFGALIVGVSPPGSNNTICSIAFNDTIIPYTGYTVSLISATGNAYPGYPQSWQLNGGLNGTVNISQGAPLWNGTVIYPMPLLSQPLNHGPQSISGNLDHGGYNDTNIGVMTAGSVNSVVNANLQTGSDIGAQVNAGIAACAQQCTVYVPAGGYSFSTPISLPLNVYGTYKLTGDPGAVLTYTGTGDAIVTPIGARPTAAQLIIEGFQLNGTSAATNGIHLLPSNRITIRNMLIQNFSSGNGILVEGTNSSNIYDNLITNNKNGVQLETTFCSAGTPAVCSQSNLSGSVYAANAINIHDNQITNNSQWAVKIADSPGNGDSGALDVNVSWNDLELEGIGSVYSGKSTGLIVFHNYIEGSPHGIVLGLLGGGSYYGTVGASVTSNYFTTVPGTPYNIELQNADRTTLTGNTEQGGPGVSSANCMINVGGVETNTFLLPNSIVQGSVAGNRLCIAGTQAQTFAGAGSFVLYNTNYKSGIAYASFPITAAASDTQAAINVASSSTCHASAATNASQATAQSLIASVYVQAGNGQFTIFHPTGHAGLLYDVYCTGPLN